MYIKLIKSIVALLFASLLLTQTARGDFEIIETSIQKPEDVALLAQNFINKNDLYGYISLFPLTELKKDITAVDVMVRLGTYSPGAVFPYFNIFDSSRTNTIVNENSSFFLAVKLALNAHGGKSLVASPDIKSEKQAKALQDAIEIAANKSIKISIVEKNKGPTTSLFKSDESYVFGINIQLDDGTVLSKKGSLRVEKVNGKWHLTSAFM